MLDNWPVPAKLVADTARQVLGENGLAAHVVPDLTAEDFGFYMQDIPGSFLWLGCGTEGQPVHGLHNAKMCPNENALVVGSKLMSQVVINALDALQKGVDFTQKD